MVEAKKKILVVDDSPERLYKGHTLTFPSGDSEALSDGLPVLAN